MSTAPVIKKQRPESVAERERRYQLEDDEHRAKARDTKIKAEIDDAANLFGAMNVGGDSNSSPSTNSSNQSGSNRARMTHQHDVTRNGFGSRGQAQTNEPTSHLNDFNTNSTSMYPAPPLLFPTQPSALRTPIANAYVSSPLTVDSKSCHSNHDLSFTALQGNTNRPRTSHDASSTYSNQSASASFIPTTMPNAIPSTAQAMPPLQARPTVSQPGSREQQHIRELEQQLATERHLNKDIESIRQQEHADAQHTIAGLEQQADELNAQIDNLTHIAARDEIEPIYVPIIDTQLMQRRIKCMEKAQREQQIAGPEAAPIADLQKKKKKKKTSTGITF